VEAELEQNSNQANGGYDHYGKRTKKCPPIRVQHNQCQDAAKHG
jgi:hypothetical protein